MIKIEGIYEGTFERPYDFTPDGGTRKIGTTRKASVRINDVRIQPKYRVKEVKLMGDAVIKAKINDEVLLEVDSDGKNFVLLAEVKK